MAAAGEEPVDRVRAALIALGAVALAIGLLVSLPTSSRAARGGGIAAPTGGTGAGGSTTTTTSPASGGPGTSTGSTVAPASYRVAIVTASTASPAVLSVKAKLVADHFALFPLAAVPSSEISAITTTEVHYPAGTVAAAGAARVATALGVAQSAVAAEAPGTSVSMTGTPVIEVIVPVG